MPETPVHWSLAKAEPEVRLLNGGSEAFPAMLEAIAQAQRVISLEIYTFALDRVGHQFMDALSSAASRGVRVNVTVDGWGSFSSARQLKAQLRAVGAHVKVYNPLTGFFSGKLWRNHRKILLVDDQRAFVGGINISDDYAADGQVPGWADLAVEFTGPVARQLSERVKFGTRFRFRPVRAETEPLRVFLSGLRGGGRMRERYLRALEQAKSEVLLAHAYFFPNGRFLRALRAAARRKVRVRLLLAGKSDVGPARAATMRLYRTLLYAGVEIHEWVDSTLHAKTAVVDGRHLLLGSFNLDPLSLVNLETLVEAQDLPVCRQVAGWIEDHLERSPRVTLEDCARSPLQRWLTDRVGLFFARLLQVGAQYLGRNRRRELK